MFFVCLSHRKSPSSRTIILSQVLVLICLRWLGKYGLLQLPTSFLLTFFDCCRPAGLSSQILQISSQWSKHQNDQAACGARNQPDPSFVEIPRQGCNEVFADMSRHVLHHPPWQVCWAQGCFEKM